MLKFSSKISFTTGILFCIFLFLGGCVNNNPDEKIVAKVNGKGITLHSLEVLLDSKFTPMTVFHDNSLSSLKKYYGEALKTLIINELIQQYLQDKDIDIKKDILDNEIDVIKSDFMPETLDNYFDGSLMEEDEWKKLMQYHMNMEIFVERILMPKVKIDSSEVSDYYKLHENEFTIPDTIEIYFVNAPEKEIIEDFCANRQNDFSLFSDEISIQKQEITYKEAQDLYKNDFKNMRANFCGSVKQAQNCWQVTALGGKKPARKKELIEVYALIENILLKEKLDAAFAQWLEEIIKTSKITIMPELAEALLDQEAPAAP